MKRMLLIFLSNVFVFSFSLECMQTMELAVNQRPSVGAFAYAAHGKKQNARYDMKIIDGSMVIGLFDGDDDREVATFLKDDFLNFIEWRREIKKEDKDEKIQWSRDSENQSQNTLKRHLLKAYQRFEWDVRYGVTEDPTAKSTLFVSSFDAISRKAEFALLGDSVIFLSGNNALSISSPHDKNDITKFIGGRDYKREGKKGDYKKITPEYYSDMLDDRYEYIVLATKGLYEVLAHDDEERCHDFKNIFFNVLNVSERKFNTLYPLPNSKVIWSNEGSDSDDDIDNASYHELKRFKQDRTLRDIAKRLVHVALSRGCQDNITVIVQCLQK